MHTERSRLASRNFGRRAFLQGSAVLASMPFLGGGAIAQSAAGSTLTIVPSQDLRVLDPVTSTTAATAMHSWMVYDVLIARNSSFEPQPQMISGYEVSDDGLRYAFTLRPGLKFHDGSGVRAADCVASITRWHHTAPGGQVIFSYLDGFDIDSDDVFAIRLTQPLPGLIEMLSDPTRPIFIMREDDANLPPTTPVEQAVGSGPFTFDQDNWQPGVRAIYLRNEDYLPRDEKADGLAGGKHVEVDRVVWLHISDASTSVTALSAGEVDIVDAPAQDLLPLLDVNPDIQLAPVDPGWLAIFRLNHNAPPFDNPEVRRAVLALVLAEQERYLPFFGGELVSAQSCLSPFGCGFPDDTDAGMEAFTAGGHVDRAREAIEAVGYTGPAIRMLDPSDNPMMSSCIRLFAEQLRDIGLTVDVQPMDFATLAARRAVQESPNDDPNGWHVFVTIFPALSLANPLTNTPLDSRCDGNNWFGWPCDEEIETIKRSLVGASADMRSEIMGALQTQFFESVPYIPVGQFTRPAAYRTDIVSGELQKNTLVPVFWGVGKT